MQFMQLNHVGLKLTLVNHEEEARIRIGGIYKHPSTNVDEFTMILDEFFKQLKRTNMKYISKCWGIWDMNSNIDLLKHVTSPTPGCKQVGCLTSFIPIIYYH